MNIEKHIKRSLGNFAKETGLGIRIQKYWILASIDEAYDASIIIEIGKAEYPFWVNYNHKGKARSKPGKMKNILEMGDLTSEQKKKFLDTKTPFLANDGEYCIPLTLSNRDHSDARSNKSQGTIKSQPSENSLPSSESMAKFIHFLAATMQSSKRTQRIMADEVGISVAAVNKYLQELAESNYIVNDRKRLRLVDPGKFLDLWTVEYIKKILPRTEKLTFNPYDDKQYRDLRANPIKLKTGYWSATKAADVLTKTELPDRFGIYSNEPLDVVKELRLRPSESGVIQIRKKFWNFDWQEKAQGIVDLPLIYADLMESSDPRDSTIATGIREAWIRSL